MFNLRQNIIFTYLARQFRITGVWHNHSGVADVEFERGDWIESEYGKNKTRTWKRMFPPRYEDAEIAALHGREPKEIPETVRSGDHLKSLFEKGELKYEGQI